MALLQWKDQYSVGIDAVDYEHRELIALINRLHDELMTKGKESSISTFFWRPIRGHFRAFCSRREVHA